MSMKENANIIPKLNKVVKKIHKNYQSLPDDSIPSKLHELLIVPTICLTLSTKVTKIINYFCLYLLIVLYFCR